MSVEETGTANFGGNFVISNASNPYEAVYVLTYGTGNAGFFEINNASNANVAVHGTTTGTGYAGQFEINNASNTQSALRATTVGAGDVISAQTTGTGGAGNFVIGNAGNSSSLLVGNTTGTGNILQLQQGGVDKFVVDNTGKVGIGTSTPSAQLDARNTNSDPHIAPIEAYDISALAADKGGTISFGGNYTGATTTEWAGVAGRKENGTDGDYSGYLVFFTRINGSAMNEKMRITSAGNVLVGNPAFTTANVSAEETGTVNNAGYFKISNVGNANDAVYGYTSGSGAAIFGYGAGSGNAVYGYVSSTTGKAGYFDIQNAVNSASVLEGNTTGTGNLLQLQQSYVNKFVVDNTGSVGMVKNAAQPSACGAPNDGYVALTSAYRLCV